MEKRNLLNALRVTDVWDLVVKNPAVIKQDESLARLLEVMVEDPQTRNVYVVDDQQQLLGVVRMTMVISLLFPLQALGRITSRQHWFRQVNVSGKTVREVMNKRPPTVRADTRLQDMARVLLEEGITELPVVDSGGKLVGRVNMYEIIRAYLELRHSS